MYKKCTNAVNVLNEFKESPWPHQVDLTTEEESQSEHGTDIFTQAETEVETIADDDASEFVMEGPSSNDLNGGDEVKGVEDDEHFEVDLDCDNNADISPNAVSFDSIEMLGDNENYKEAVHNDANFGRQNGRENGEDTVVKNIRGIDVAASDENDDTAKGKAKAVLNESLEVTTVLDDPIVGDDAVDIN